MANKTIQMTRVNLSELTRFSAEDREKLEILFNDAQCLRRLATEKRRELATMQANSAMADASAVKAELELQTFGAKLNNIVATESAWMPAFRTNEGDICLESPVTMRDQRVAARAMHNQMVAQASEIPDIFEDGDNEKG